MTKYFVYQQKEVNIRDVILKLEIMEQNNLGSLLV